MSITSTPHDKNWYEANAPINSEQAYFKLRSIDFNMYLPLPKKVIIGMKLKLLFIIL